MQQRTQNVFVQTPVCDYKHILWLWICIEKRLSTAAQMHV